MDRKPYTTHRVVLEYFNEKSGKQRAFLRREHRRAVKRRVAYEAAKKDTP